MDYMSVDEIFLVTECYKMYLFKSIYLTSAQEEGKNAHAVVSRFINLSLEVEEQNL